MTQFERLPARILSLGDLVGLAFRLLRLHLKTFFRLLILPSLGAATGANASYNIFTEWLKVAGPSQLNPLVFVQHMSLVLAGIVLWLFSYWLLFWRSSVMARAIYVGVDYAEAMSQLKKRSLTFMAIYTVSSIPAILAVLFWAVVAVSFSSLVPRSGPGMVFIGGLGYAFIGFWFTVTMAFGLLYGGLTQAVAIAELSEFPDVLKRAFTLARARLLRGASMTCLAVLSGMCLSLSIEWPGALLEILQESVWNIKPTVYSTIFTSFFEVIEAVFTNAFVALVVVLYYRDLLFRSEGSDLQARLSDFARTNP